MSPKRQKGKGGKRRRSWHHGPLEDRRFDEAIQRLQTSTSDEADRVSGNGHPPMKEQHTQKDEPHE